MTAVFEEISAARLSPMALTIVLLASGCVQPEAQNERPQGAISVTNGDQPFQLWEGAAARKAADAQCGPKGVRSSIYDRFDRATGEWVYPGGCA